MTFKISYDTANNQNIFTTSSLDDLPLFVNNNIIDNNIVLTKIERSGSIETRTILVKNITENKTIFFNLTSLTRATANVTNTSAIYDVRSINVKNSNL
jgi:predicted metalloprotease